MMNRTMSSRRAAGWRVAWQFAGRHRSQLCVVLIPLLLLPIPLVVQDQKGLCGYMLLLMASFWCTEALPLPVTGFIPVFLAPMFGLLSTQEVICSYSRHTIMMLVGGVIVGQSIENSNLHKRIALKVLLVCGTRPQWLLFGSMLPTWFLSMWISNTATVSMMLPITEAVLEQLHPHQLHDEDEGLVMPNETAIQTDTTSLYASSVHLDREELDKKEDEDRGLTMGRVPTRCSTGIQCGESSMESAALRAEKARLAMEGREDDSKLIKDYEDFGKVLLLAVTFASNVGGIGALTGTGPNLIMYGYANEMWRSHGLGESPVNYSSWMVMGMPIAFINVLLVWAWLIVYNMGFKGLFPCIYKKHMSNRAAEARATRVIRREYTSLGNVRFAEKASGAIFMVLVCLWLFRAPGFMPGWASVYPKGYVMDAVPALFIAFVMFAVPYNAPQWGPGHGSDPVRNLLDWKYVQSKYPWSVIFIMGGGFALADASNASGLSVWIGEQLSVFAALPTWLMLYLITFMVAMITQMTTNAATCTIVMPILAAMSESMGKSPLFLMFPGAISTSLSYMLPVSNPTNAIAYTYGRLKVSDFAKSGFLLVVIGSATVALATYTWGYVFFQLDVVPWAVDASNVTAAALNLTQGMV